MVVAAFAKKARAKARAKLAGSPANMPAAERESILAPHAAHPPPRPNAQPTAATAGKASGGEGCKGGGAVVGILGDRRSLVAFWYGATLVFNYTCALFLRFTKPDAKPDGAAGPPVLYAEDVTVLEMLACTVIGAATLLSHRLPLVPPPEARATLACAVLANAASCRLFLLSISWPGMSIPISLTQTIRASQPLFTCAVLFAAFGQRFSTAVYSSLVVILAGFALSGWADARFDLVGCGCACASVTLLVVTNTLTRRLSGVNGITQLQLQAWTTGFSFVLLVPPWLYGIPGLPHAVSPGGGVARVAAAFMQGTESAAWWSTSSLIGCNLWNAVAYHMANVGTFSAIGAFDPLTFAVIDTMRRLLVVVLAFWTQNNLDWATGLPWPLDRLPDPLNLLGVFTVCLGAGWYATLKASATAAAAVTAAGGKNKNKNE